MKPDLKDYYQVLGLPRNATSEDIRRAYRLYAAKFHPDKHEGDSFFVERFRELNEAHDTLIDPDRRWKYDIRKFKNSKVKPTADDFEGTRVTTGDLQPPGKFNMKVTHLDVYISIFYFINLATGILIRNGDEVTLPGKTVLLSIGVVSALFIWLMVNGMMQAGKTRSESQLKLAVYALIAIALGYLSIWPLWE